MQKKLKGALRGATEEEQKHIDATIKRLEAVRATTADVCSKVWSVWPIEDSQAVSRAAVPAKP
ncbi:MAG TPA: hypothetical protein VJU18_18350 [Vicinamibacteria bacterium]|nr:hypothetical protein [Vicinamibacteria bacterium]